MGRRSINRDPLGLCGVGYDQKIMSGVNRDWTYWNYLRYLYVLAISRFKWNNLPDTVSERVIEQTLIMKGNCLFLKTRLSAWLPYLPQTQANLTFITFRESVM